MHTYEGMSMFIMMPKNDPHNLPSITPPLASNRNLHPPLQMPKVDGGSEPPNVNAWDDCSGPPRHPPTSTPTFTTPEST